MRARHAAGTRRARTRGTFAVITGGGTAGHVLPALAIADALVAKGHPPASIRFVGSRRGQEARAVPQAGYAVTLLPGRGIVRKLDGRSLVANGAALAALGVAFVRSVAMIAARRPAVVVSVGGYASVPYAVAAAIFKVPVLLVNTDALPGAANRLVGRFARRCAVAFPETPLPRAALTGAPLRREFELCPSPDAARAAGARAELGLPSDMPVVAAVGGSLGARRINDAVAEMVDRWRRADAGPVAVYHVVGRRDWDRVRSGPRPGAGSSGVLYTVVPYEERMAALYCAADLVVCRAGAITVAELGAVGTPAVLVPFPDAPGDHQSANARALVRAGAGVIVRDDQCTAERLDEVVGGLLRDARRLDQMALSARGLRRAGAAAAIVDLVEEVAA